MQNDSNDIVPTGLDCPNLGLCLVPDLMKSCDLCDSEGAVRFLKVKGVEYSFDKAARIQELLRETAEEAVGEEGKGKAAGGKSVEGFGGELVDGAEGSSGERGGGAEGRVNRVWEMVERRGDGAASKRRRSGLAESSSASMGWD